jgi:hypothetical protein
MPPILNLVFHPFRADTNGSGAIFAINYKQGLSADYGLFVFVVTTRSQLRRVLRKVSAAVSTLRMYLEEAWEARVLPLNHSRFLAARQE